VKPDLALPPSVAVPDQLRQEAEAVWSTLLAADHYADVTVDLLWFEIRRFVLSLAAEEVQRLADVTEDNVLTFLYEPVMTRGPMHDPSTGALHSRRTSVRAVFRLARYLNFVRHDPSLDIALPSKSGVPARALSDDEQHLCQIAAFYSRKTARLPAVWAIGQAGASNAELSRAAPGDLDLPRARVWLSGDRHRVPRWGPLTPWGVEQLERRLEDDPNADLPIAAKSTSDAIARVVACQAISKVLRKAGLFPEPDIKPLSLAMWLARREFEETGRLDRVARLLGVKSLDAAARLACWDWQDD
jgi:integrase/recombinase XerC